MAQRISEAEVVDDDGVVTVLPDGEEDAIPAAAPIPMAAPPATGINVYTSLLIVSTVAYVAATAVTITWLREYCDPAKWWFW